MKSYKYRNWRKISKIVSIAYLTTAICWGIAGCGYHIQREQLKDEYRDGDISHQQYITKSREFGEKEENIFKCLGIGFGLTFATDMACMIAGKDKEY